MDKTEKILVVDDSRVNLTFLSTILEEEGYATWEAVNGKVALKLLENNKPDIILLDIRMPFMDGLEVCRRIKQNPDLVEIPVIFISAAAETVDKVEGLSVGAVDYITKPFEREELLIRVKTHLSLREKETKLTKVNEELLLYKNNLESLVKKRTDELEDSNKELVIANAELKEQKEKLELTLKQLNETQSQLLHSEKMASLGVLVAGVAHEINNPVNFINSSVLGLKNNLQFLENYSKLYAQLSDNPPGLLQQIEEKEKEASLEELTQMFKRSVEIIEVGIGRTTKIVKSLKSFARSDKNEIELFDISVNIENTLIILHNYYKDRIEIIKDYGQVPMIECYTGQINQVLLNILINAMQAIEKKGQIRIKLGLKDKENVFIEIKDSGAGIPKEKLSEIFDAFYTTKGEGQGTGLGLSISNKIIKEHGGKIIVESKEGEGSSFTIVLPIQQNHP